MPHIYFPVVLDIISIQFTYFYIIQCYFCVTYVIIVIINII